MNRTLRITLNVASVLSLALFSAAIVLWSRSATHWDQLAVNHWRGVGRESHGSSWSISSGDGGLMLSHAARRMILADPASATYAPSPWIVRTSSQARGFRPLEWKTPAGVGWVSASGAFGFWRESSSGRYQPVRGEDWFGSYTELNVAMPHWFPTLVGASLPASLALRTIVRRRRLVAGCCQTCGYDLRATPDRCPECGAIPTKATA